MKSPIPVFLVSQAPTRFYPLALGLIQALAHNHENLREEVRFLPFMDAPLSATLKIAQAFGPGIWLFSNYAWSYQRTMNVSRAVKSLDPRNITIHGGPSIPAYPEACRRLFQEQPHLDIAVRGEGEITCREVLGHLVTRNRSGDDWREGLESVAGITWAHPDQPEPIRNPDRPRIEKLDDIPSPYLQGLFDSMPRLLAVLETNRGCPYTCAFCDWGSLVGQKIKCFDLERVKAEIDWIGRRETSNLYLTDANFGIFERDLEISKAIADTKAKYGFPRKVTPTFAKHSTDRLVEILKILRDGGVIVEANLGIQTADPVTLAAINRTNIRVDRYRDLMMKLRAQNLAFNTDLMVNLPGQTPETFRQDLQHFIDLDVTLMIWPTMVLPNSAMADPEYRKKYRLKTDENGLIQSCSSFTPEQRSEMMRLRSTYFMAEHFSYLRYLMRYLQWDHGIPSSVFLDQLQRAIGNEQERFPDFMSHFIFMGGPASGDEMIPESSAFRQASWNRLSEFYVAIERFVVECMDIPSDSSLHTVLRANQAVIPDPSVSYPATLALEHDVVRWFHDRKIGKELRLRDYAPGILTIHDPEERAKKPSSQSTNRNSVREQTWELSSELRSIPATMP